MSGSFIPGEWFALLQHELLLFAAVFFAIGAVDEIAVDIAYLWMRLRRRFDRTEIGARELTEKPLSGLAAVFIPAWQEQAVIGHTITHALAAWPQNDLRIYVGCYRNDPATVAAVQVAAGDDGRIRTVVHNVDGPTDKADCLNRLYTALCAEEDAEGSRARMIVLHDAEDMVDPLALPLLDRAMDRADFVQLPVMALPQTNSLWIGGHYTDEFAELHTKTMPVRDVLGAGLPGAGVGCAITRDMVSKLDRVVEGDGPFARNALTEDYELGLKVSQLGGRSSFLRRRTRDRRLVATRAYFPAKLEDAVRQKTRWTHGIAFQGWDRLGWHGSLPDIWMQLRDRRGPFAALLLAIGYFLVLTTIVGWALSKAGLFDPLPLTPLLKNLLIFDFCALLWRLVVRAFFTWRDFGWRQGLLAVPRGIVSNIVAIMSGRRALVSYVGTLRGKPVKWEKTEHYDHPISSMSKRASS